MSARIARLLLAVVAIGLSIFPFLRLLQLGVDVVKIYGGLAAFAGLASLIPLAIAEMAFVIAVDAVLGRGQRKDRLLESFLFVAGAELLLLPAIEALRFALYAPINAGRLDVHRAVLRPGYLPLAAAGLAIGVAALAAAACLAVRRARRAPGPRPQLPS
jgi:hypothetical protein